MLRPGGQEASVLAGTCYVTWKSHYSFLVQFSSQAQMTLRVSNWPVNQSVNQEGSRGQKVAQGWVLTLTPPDHL